jgi:hypothetical protein
VYWGILDIGQYPTSPTLESHEAINVTLVTSLRAEQVPNLDQKKRPAPAVTFALPGALSL